MEQFQEFISHWITTFYLYLDPHLVERPRVLDDRAQTYQVLLGVFCLALLALVVPFPASVRRGIRRLAFLMIVVAALPIAYDAWTLVLARPTTPRPIFLFPPVLILLGTVATIYIVVWGLVAIANRPRHRPAARQPPRWAAVTSAAAFILGTAILVLLFWSDWLPHAPMPSRPMTMTTDTDALHVFFGTDRLKTLKDAKWRFANSRGRELTVGTADVSIPVEHKPGFVEVPREYGLFGISIWSEQENAKKHFLLRDTQLLAVASFVVAARSAVGSRPDKSAFVFIHGYNTSFIDGLFRTAQIAYDLGLPGVLFYYSWPSLGGFDVADQSAATQAEPHLRRFLELVVKETQAERINIIAHSMGNMPLLRVLKDLDGSMPQAERAKVRQIILAAPDVDRDVFEQLATAATRVGNVTLYASSNDRAMAASRIAAGGAVRAGDVPDSGPILIELVDTIDISAASTEVLALNHSTYASSPELIRDVRELMVCDLRPPTMRSNSFEPVPLGDGHYWKLKPTSAHEDRTSRCPEHLKQRQNTAPLMNAPVIILRPDGRSLGPRVLVDTGDASIAQQLAHGALLAPEVCH